MSNATTDPIFNWTGAFGLPEFDAVKDDAFEAAFAKAFAEHDAEMAAIANSPSAPDFTNTIEAMELAGDKLSRVSALFWNKAGADTNDVIQALERVIAPQMSRHYSKIAMNKALFERVDAVYRNRDDAGLNAGHRPVVG